MRFASFAKCRITKFVQTGWTGAPHSEVAHLMSVMIIVNSSIMKFISIRAVFLHGIDSLIP